MRHLFLPALLVAFATASPARAAQSYDNCTGFVDSVPATITTQGVWCLRADLSTAIATGSAITIAANNVTLDCNDFKLGGLAAGLATVAAGVLATERSNVTVQNCNIRGFAYGIALQDGAGHLLQSNRLDRNTFNGIRVDATGWTVRGNHVVNTGGSSLVSEATGISGGGENFEILDNTVAGLTASGTNAGTAGIFVTAFSSGVVQGNRVQGVFTSGTFTSGGIITAFGTQVTIRDNVVHGTGAPLSTGIRCNSNASTARDNVVARFPTGISECAISSNYVNIN